MIHGAHVIVFSTDAEADRAFFRDVLGFGSVDVGHGWLIFALPPAELAVHPVDASQAPAVADSNQELYLMCDDIEAFVARMTARGIACSALQTRSWGTLTELTLPSGGSLGVYQPRHASPPIGEVDPRDGRADKAARMERTIRAYFDACNTGDADAVAAFFTADGVHYFPPGMYSGPFVGGRAIGERWAWAVETLGSRWSVDHVICDPDTDRAVIEWTHTKTKDGVVLRGDEWYVFDAGTGLIREIRAYYASPQAPDLSRLELQGFSYADRGYP